MIKAILIDPENRTISEVLVDEKDFLNSCYKLIGCNLIEVAVDLLADIIWVDEEGLCKQVKGMFSFVGAHQHFAGRGLVVGYSPSADTNEDTTLTVQDMIDCVRWV